jgi:hypothetical protein
VIGDIARWLRDEEASASRAGAAAGCASRVQNGAETRDIYQHQDDNETGPDQHRSS